MNDNNNNNNESTKVSKTGRKNNINQSVNWPEKGKYFMFDELQSLNVNIIPITLRTKLKSAIKTGMVKEIGTLNLKKGRPKSICSLTPVSNETLLEAQKNGVVLVDSLNSVVIAKIETNESNIDNDQQIKIEKVVSV